MDGEKRRKGAVFLWIVDQEVGGKSNVNSTIMPNWVCHKLSRPSSLHRANCPPMGAKPL